MAADDTRPPSLKSCRVIVIATLQLLFLVSLLATECEGGGQRTQSGGQRTSRAFATFVPCRSLSEGKPSSSSSSCMPSTSATTKRTENRHVCGGSTINPHLLHAGAGSSNTLTTCCATTTESQESWSPRSLYWANDDFFQHEEMIQLGIDLESLSSSPTEELFDDINGSSSLPVATTIHRNKAGSAIAVEIASALTIHHVEKLRTLSKFIARKTKQQQPKGHNNKLEKHLEHRSFGDGKGGNDCTYLAPLLQVVCPDVATRVVEIASLAWSAASWDDPNENNNNSDSNNKNACYYCHPDPTSLGIRTSEHLSYKGWRSLEAHKDIGSIYTIMISIKDPTEYQGGEFFINNSLFESTNVKLQQLSAIVFLSDTTIHGVRPITSGHRESFVTELWTNEDSPIGLCRPTVEEWEDYIIAAN
jgi:hypothetical protein